MHRFEQVLNAHGIDVSCQALARWVIQCYEHFQPLVNLIRDSSFASRIILCDEAVYRH
ncbi:IS66 family transposase [Pseudomonas viridiflava]|nr:IS66 family transposase [Pseudomonas viridiflava]